jgi:kynurenine 3-monooxygenase
VVATQIKCSTYHDPEGSAVLIGDAAHATSPTLGQGCNAALEDAATLAGLLLEMVTDLNNMGQVAKFVGYF